MVRVKICGITNIEDAMTCVNLGVHALGFIFYEKSPRYVTQDQVMDIIQKLPPFVSTVGVFVNDAPESIYEIKQKLNLSYVQVYYDDESLYGKLANLLDKKAIIRPYRISDNFDANVVNNSEFFPLLEGFTEKYGGAGAKFNWEELRKVSVPFILAGGIRIDNVAEALGYKPYALDISIGVESYPGKKDETKIREILRRIGYDV
ncbi:phosphoribosylanthranilate isomerase [Fervidobacterium pennivorans subsp. carthaginiensis]|uniref:phosphoribosylanthranilate isomerase n=1 Tax=Fervidobacterium pennivorans TaxID=93466 RepID=UPI00355B2D21